MIGGAARLRNYNYPLQLENYFFVVYDAAVLN